MDVHSTNYTLAAQEPTIGAEDRTYGEIQVAPDYKEVLRFIESLKLKLGLDNEYSIECGYEAGCLGYYRRDAHLIAQCLCYGGYHPVYIPTGEDDAVKEYLRMRDDHKLALKS